MTVPPFAASVTCGANLTYEGRKQLGNTSSIYVQFRECPHTNMTELHAQTHVYLFYQFPKSLSNS